MLDIKSLEDLLQSNISTYKKTTIEDCASELKFAISDINFEVCWSTYAISIMVFDNDYVKFITSIPSNSTHTVVYNMIYTLELLAREVVNHARNSK